MSDQTRERQTAAQVVSLQKRLDESRRLCDKRYQRILTLEAALIVNKEKVTK